MPLLLRYALLGAIGAACGYATTEYPDVAAHVRNANEQIALYHGDSATRTRDRKLRFVYFAPQDSPPAENYRQRLTRVMDEIVRFYDREFKRLGLQAQPIPLDREDDGLLRILLVRGKEPWTVYNTKKAESANRVREECLPTLQAAGIDPTRETIVLFSTIMQWTESNRRFREDAPYRGDGDARSGFCWQIDAPMLDPVHLADKGHRLHDGQVGFISLGRWNSRYIGGVAHELGHALGLYHNQESTEEQARLGTSLMGTGNLTFGRELRNEGLGTFLSTADALQLASHPLFTGSTKGLEPSAHEDKGFSELALHAEEGALIISGRIATTPLTYAVVAYLDGLGRADYDALTLTTIPTAEGRFRLRCTDLPKGKLTEVSLQGLKVNGLTVIHSFPSPIRVSPQGNVGEAGLRYDRTLGPIIGKLRVGQLAEARSLAALLPETEPARRLAAPMLTPPDQHLPLSEVRSQEILLCEVRPIRASVGWREPAYGYSPEDLFVQIDGKHVAPSIYAHAPSHYQWNLDGAWKYFEATCAIGNGYEGTVDFVVKVDGKERWRSGVLRGKQSQSCVVPLQGAAVLELIVEDGGDDLHQDHAFWLTPTLKR